MKWIEITVYTTDEGLEIVGARLDAFGITQLVQCEGAGKVETFLNETARYWDYADINSLAASEPHVKAYVAGVVKNKDIGDEIRRSMYDLKTMDIGVDLGSLRVDTAYVNDADWVNNWKAFYTPMNVGERLLIRPSWEKAANPDGRIVLAMDPGMAFGTGSHHTTRMCLELAEQNVSKGDSVLDIGCGSGILSIASILLGAKNVLAVDIDPIVENIVYKNASLNGIGRYRYKYVNCDILEYGGARDAILKEKYDVIFANIVASVIIELAPFIPPLLADGGRFITSGIISERHGEVEAALNLAGLRVVETRQSEDWVALVAAADI